MFLVQLKQCNEWTHTNSWLISIRVLFLVGSVVLVGVCQICPSLTLVHVVPEKKGTPVVKKVKTAKEKESGEKAAAAAAPSPPK
jgi:hypothetical protein